MSQTLSLNMECQEYLSKSINQIMSGFIINTTGKNYIVTVHHFLPIKKVIETETNQELPILINSSWSEMLVLDSKDLNLDKYTIYKDIQNKFPKPNDKLSMECDNKRYILKVCGFDFLPYDNLNTEVTLPYIRATVDTDETEFAGLSGMPVFSGNKLVGIFSKSYSNDKIFLVIPIYVLIKNLEKKDNNHIYKFPNTPKKINSYVVKEGKEIYHPTLKFDIPLNTYLLLEGDQDAGLVIQHFSGKTSFEKMILDTSFGNMIEYNLIQSNKTTYLITPRLLALLKRIFDTKVLRHISKLIETSEAKSDKIWLFYDKGYFKIV